MAQNKGFMQKLRLQIKEARMAARMTQQQLADKVGSTQSSIARFETTDQKVLSDLVQRIADVLGREVEVILK